LAPWRKNPLAGQVCLWFFTDKPDTPLAVSFRNTSARASAEAKDVTFLIHGDRFGSIAGKVKTCFSRAFSQANPTVEIHGA